MNIDIKCEYEQLVPVKDLKPNPKNPNKRPAAQADELAFLIKAHGWRVPIIVSTRSGMIVAGHGRLMAAKLLEMESVPVDYQDFESDELEYAFLTSDNAISEWSAIDRAMVNEALPDLGPDFDIRLLGLENFTLDVSEHNTNDADATPDTPKEAKTKRGELWTLGMHRLLIDDCTVKENVERLMAGEKADMVFTDPPYGIGYEYDNHDDSSSDENSKLVAAALSAQDCGKVWTPGLMNLSRDLQRFPKLKVAVWHKKFAAAGNGLGGASTWEPILILNPTNKRLNNDVLVIQTEREMVGGVSLRELHSCPKPVELYVQLLSALSGELELIFEPFCGSGTTLIACEKTGRACRGMEISPNYADVILSRWAKYTGQDPIRQNDDGTVTKWSDLCAQQSQAVS